jgi:N-acetylmuramoyl-L-alanine amidase
MRVVISSGHGKYVRGASGLIDEVDEARKVVPEVASWLTVNGHQVIEFHDDVSTTQQQNLNTIVNYHNKQTRDLDVSVHFNAYVPTDGGRGTEVLYLTHQQLATDVAKAISDASGLINRGAHKRSDLYFLNGTTEPAILIEVCFVDAAADVEQYQRHFKQICRAIAQTIAPEPGAVADQTIRMSGKVSWFGGPKDMGVSPSEGLAFIYDVETKPQIFLDEQPPGTTGLARRLDPETHYIAMRWDYENPLTSKEALAGDDVALVRAPKTGRQFQAHPADWGPHVDTGRVADISPGLMEALGIETDDEVEVKFPARRPRKPPKKQPMRPPKRRLRRQPKRLRRKPMRKRSRKSSA